MERQYAIFVVENGSRDSLYEINNMDEAIGVINSYTYGYLCNSEDMLIEEYFKNREFFKLRNYLEGINPEKNWKKINAYITALNILYETKDIKDLEYPIKCFNKFLKYMGVNTVLSLDSRDKDDSEPLGPCGL